MNAAEHEWWLKNSELELPVRNADNDSLGPLRLVGLVWEVNGDGAQEFPDFNATKHELITLAKYWAEIAIDIEYRSLENEEDISVDARRRHFFAWKRVDRVIELLGEEDADLDRALEMVEESYAARQDSAKWQSFLNTSTNERFFLVRLEPSESSKSRED